MALPDNAKRFAVGDDGSAPSPLTAAQHEFQQTRLAQVSRTFALNIPMLREPLGGVVGNAYLLLRVADTIEDAPYLKAARKREWLNRLPRVVEQPGTAAEFSAELEACATFTAAAEERRLVAELDRLTAITHGVSHARRTAVIRCLSVACNGMADFAARGGPDGLAHLAEFDRYCYVVAGVVGEMLAELFVLDTPRIDDAGPDRFERARAFGRALQTTNILKDINDDARRGVCWLPRRMPGDVGVERSRAERVVYLADRAQADLRDALAFTLAVPPERPDIRRFCLLPLGLAGLTLRRIRARPDFDDAAQIKVPRFQLHRLRGAIESRIANDARLREDFEAMMNSPADRDIAGIG